MKTMKLPAVGLLFYLCVSAFVMESILKYNNVLWSVNQYRTIASMNGNVLSEWKIAEIFLISFMFLLSFPLKRNMVTYSGLALMTSGVIWLVREINIPDTVSLYKNAFDVHFEMIALQMTPATMIFMGMTFIIAQSPTVQRYMVNVCPFCAVFYTVLCLINSLDFMRSFPGMRMADGKIIEYFLSALFLLGIWSIKGRNSKLHHLIIYICAFVLIFCSIIITSRGWMLQSFLLLIFCYISFSERIISSRLTRICLLLSVFIVMYIMAQHFLGDQIRFIISRFSKDTRSGQLMEFFSQVPLSKLAVGQGMNASYSFAGQSSYKYIDNQFLFFMFRYGVIPLVLYLLPFACSLFGKSCRNKAASWLSQKFVIIMWLLAMGGLSVYFTLRIDISGFFILIFAISGCLRKKGLSAAL